MRPFSIAIVIPVSGGRPVPSITVTFLMTGLAERLRNIASMSEYYEKIYFEKTLDEH